MKVNIDRLRSRITERGYTIATLAEKSTISESTLYRVLNGTLTPKVGTLEMIAAPLDVTVEWLTSGVNDSKTTAPVKNESEYDSKMTETVINETENETVQEAIPTTQELFARQLQMMNEHLEYSRKQFRAACIVILVLMAFICSIFAYDILNPNIGWFRK